MLPLFTHRTGHYLVLVVAHFLLTLPNLGAHSLWDMDEGVNAEATREMLERGNFITPYFNYQLRTAKPALLYWLQGASMSVFGVNEFGARFPAVLCGLGTVLLTYELARRLFTPSTGLLAGLILASCIEFCLLSHAATPDAPLLFFFMTALTLFWFGSQDGRTWWYAPVGVAVGLATLTKGPIGIALPGVIVGLYLLWTKQYRAAFSWRLLLLVGAFILTAAPWYGLVAADTKGKWIETFFMKEYVGRFNTPQENHKGGPWFHVVLLLVLFAPWSIFLGVAGWNAIRELRRPTENNHAYRFLVTWFSVVLLVFTIAATKLPNYILPLYPAVAILTARSIDRWRTEEVAWPKWLPWAAGLGFVGVGFIVLFGILIAAGNITLPIKGLAPLPAIGTWAWLGGFLIVGGMSFLSFKRVSRTRAVGALTVSAILFLAGIAAFPTVAMNQYKAPKPLIEAYQLNDPYTEIRLGGWHWLRESTVFYAQREVTRLSSPQEANAFLDMQIPSFVFVHAKRWDNEKTNITTPYEEVARQYDFYSRDDVVLLANPQGMTLLRGRGVK